MSAMPNAAVPIRPSIVISLCASMSLGALAMTVPASADTTGVDMMKMCKPFIDVRGLEDSAGQSMAFSCMMYIKGVYEALVLYEPFWTKVCVPNISPHTLVVTVLDFVRRPPDLASTYAITLIMLALEQAYPWRPGEHQPTTPRR
jgi:hypothetical protein